MNRKFYLIDRENGSEKRRITMKFIVDHFNGDGAGPVRWNRNNVDLERFRADMDELGYDFVIERGSKSREDKLRRVEAKLALLKASRPNGDQSDRACRKLMDKICAVQERADQLMSEIRHKRVRPKRVRPKREDAEKPQDDNLTKVLNLIRQEYAKACEKHPEFGNFYTDAVSIITEELGELAKEINDDCVPGAKERALTEAAHVAVTAIRTMQMLMKGIEVDDVLR